MLMYTCVVLGVIAVVCFVLGALYAIRDEVRVTNELLDELLEALQSGRNEKEEENHAP